MKEKRFAIRSIKDRLKANFNISVAEVDYLDLWQRSLIAVTTVSNEAKRVESIMNNIDKVFESEPRVVVINSKFQFL